MLKVATLVAVMLSAPAASAASMKVAASDRGTTIAVSGPFGPGDGARFAVIASKLPQALVLLEGEGGSLEDALDIAATTGARGYATAVPSGKSCGGACALVWLAGAERSAAPRAKIVLGPVWADGPEAFRSAASLRIGTFLASIGADPRIVAAMAAGPAVLTAEAAERAGIAVSPDFLSQRP